MSVVYAIRWNFEPENSYHVRMTKAQKEKLEERMEAAKGIDDFEIWPIADIECSYEEFTDVLEGLRLLEKPTVLDLILEAVDEVD